MSECERASIPPAHPRAKQSPLSIWISVRMYPMLLFLQQNKGQERRRCGDIDVVGKVERHDILMRLHDTQSHTTRRLYKPHASKTIACTHNPISQPPPPPPPISSHHPYFYFLTPQTSPPNPTTLPNPSISPRTSLTSSAPNGNPPCTIMRIIIKMRGTGMLP